MIIIADIAGQFDALTRLISKFNRDEKFILVGDLIDRGPQSREVIEWTMSNPNVQALMGNHEHMLLDWYNKMTNPLYFCQYDKTAWISNGGFATLRSYGADFNDPESAKNIPAEHIDWLSSLPIYKEFCLESLHDRFFVSHAAWIHGSSSDYDRIWNRKEPWPMVGSLQVFGHNSHWGLKRFNREDGSLYAICIDQSRSEVLTAYNSKNGEITTVPYVEKLIEASP